MSHEICSFEDLDDHEANNCSYPKGGISAVAILKADHGITNFDDLTQTQAAITAGTYKIISKIKAELPEPGVVEGENPVACGAETVVDGFDYSLEIMDFNVNALNDEFYRKSNLSQFSGVVLYMCEEEQIRVVSRGVNIVARGPIIPRSNKEKQHYLISIKWSQGVHEDFPVLYDAPEGIFE